MTEKQLTLYMCRAMIQDLSEPHQKEVRQVADEMKQLMDNASPGVGLIALALIGAETELELEQKK